MYHQWIQIRILYKWNNLDDIQSYHFIKHLRFYFGTTKNEECFGAHRKQSNTVQACQVQRKQTDQTRRHQRSCVHHETHSGGFLFASQTCPSTADQYNSSNILFPSSQNHRYIQIFPLRFIAPLQLSVLSIIELWKVDVTDLSAHTHYKERPSSGSWFK